MGPDFGFCDLSEMSGCDHDEAVIGDVVGGYDAH